MQAVDESAPALVYVPTGHIVQCVAPAAAYDPAPHTTHASIDREPCLVDVVPGGQAAHVAALVALATVEYVPGGHAMHPLAVDDHLPAPHA